VHREKYFPTKTIRAQRKILSHKDDKSTEKTLPTKTIRAQKKILSHKDDKSTEKNIFPQRR
jgi:hypothetical protein